MTLINILALSAAALGVGLLNSKRWRGWLILAGSVLAVYWLQPASPIRHLDFWLPTATLGLVVLSWVIVRLPQQQAAASQLPNSPEALPNSIEAIEPDSWLTGLLIAVIVLGVGLTRYISALCCLIPSIPPEITQVGFALLIILVMAFGLNRLSLRMRIVTPVLVMALIGIFILLKADPLTRAASAWLRLLNGQNSLLAQAADLRWFGYSYIAFRLIHTLRDRQTGRLPAMSLQSYVNYVIFFPSLAAGPIDRIDRLLKEEKSARPDRTTAFYEGGERVLSGLFKKFVLADTLALIALSPDNYSHITTTPWMWLLVYAYAFRIYLDFSGYTDIAIGMGRWLGIKLPENFDRPYLKPNLTVFWNAWHMTLTQWFRAYFFNPLTRALRSMKKPLPSTAVILVGQFSTMILIGMWHGITWNFMIWGVWHGVGLFIHNRWMDFSRSHLSNWEPPNWLRRSLVVLGTFLTFNYVTLGWVWFALPEPAQSWVTFQKLLGF